MTRGLHGEACRSSQYWSSRLLHEIWKPKEIYIAENGCAAKDTIAADGNVYDSDCITYMRYGMLWQQTAIAARVPIKGNFYRREAPTQPTLGEAERRVAGRQGRCPRLVDGCGMTRVTAARLIGRRDRYIGDSPGRASFA